MLKESLGAVSIIYFMYTGYTAFTIGGILSIISMIYFLPYLIAGIYLLKDDGQTIAIIASLAIPAVFFYLNGIDFNAIKDIIFAPLNLVFNFALPGLMIYAAIQE